MALIDVVRNSRGLELARFLSSLDARKWADQIGGGAEVTDFGGTVTRHERGEPMRIVARGLDDSFDHVRRNFPTAIDATNDDAPVVERGL